MKHERPASIYDYPKYYHVAFGSDWKAEFDFLRACFERFGRRPTRRVLEPACGTGRLLVKLAAAGYQAHGFDLNHKAVQYCNCRLRRNGLNETAFVADMSEFRLAGKFDAAFNMINSFRHLGSEAAAEGHLRCLAKSLRPGGIYVLGLDLTPRGPRRCVEESWSARRGNLMVNSRIQFLSLDRRRRQERARMLFDVHTPRLYLQLAEEALFRTYTARQLFRLLARVGEYELSTAYDFTYEIDRPIRIGPDTEDVVLVLRKL
jgi:SAM-dependent methyltransferase